MDERPIKPMKKNLEDILEENEINENSNKKLTERIINNYDEKPIKPL